MQITDFKKNLAATVEIVTLDENKWGDERWTTLWGQINQEVLDDAFNQRDAVRSTFARLGHMDARTCKKIARVRKKMEEQLSSEHKNYFKVVSDFAAVRIPCGVNEIQEKIDCIKDVVDEEHGVMQIRGCSDQAPYGLFMSSEKEYLDIVQYVYVFVAKVGFPIEFQIGHEFAAHTFKINSALRDDPTCGKINLFAKGFYEEVKKYLLAKANGAQPDLKAEDLVAKAIDLHLGNMPEELSQILNKIVSCE